jgi:hypothetical protein
MLHPMALAEGRQWMAKFRIGAEGGISGTIAIYLSIKQRETKSDGKVHLARPCHSRAHTQVDFRWHLRRATRNSQ